MRKNRLCAALLAAVLLLSGCGRRPTGWARLSAEGAVVLAVLEDVDSPAAAAMRQAAEELTAETGVPVLLRFSENSRDYNVSAVELSDLLTYGTVSGVISGRYYPHLQSVNYICQLAGVPLTALGSCEDDILRQESPYLVTDACPAETVAEAMCGLLESRGFRRIAICYSRVPFETDCVRYLVRGLEAFGAEPVSVVSEESLTESFAMTRESWKVLEADALCILCDNGSDLSGLVRRLRQAEPELPIVWADDGLRDGLSDEEPGALDDALRVPEYLSEAAEGMTEAERQAYHAVYLTGRALIENEGSAESVAAALRALL